MRHRRALRRQQPRHYPIFVRLSVSSHFLISAPSRFRSYLGGNLSDTGGCQKGLSAGFTTAAAVVNELIEARDEKRLLRLQRQLAGYKLLVIDSCGAGSYVELPHEVGLRRGISSV